MTITPSYPPPLYHGTRAGFRGPGGLVLPGAMLGRENHAQGRSGVVYVTPDLDEAKLWAEASQGRGRAKVLQVRPMGIIGVDNSTLNGEEHEGYTCEAATVVKVVWIEETP